MGVGFTKKSFNRWTVVPYGFIINVTLGVVYAWSVFMKPLMKDFGWTTAETSLAFTILLLTFAFVMIPAGWLNDRIGPRKVASLGGILLGLGFILAGFTSSLLWLYVTYGIVAGAGVALAYVTPIATCVKWFPDKKGLVTGIIVCGFGLSSAFLAPIATYIITTTGWQSAFQMLGLVFLLVSFGAAQGLKIPPSGWCPPSWTPTPGKTPVTNDLTWKQTVKTSKFWMIWLMFTFGATAGLMVIGHAAKFAQDSGLDVAIASLAVSVLAIFNALGRISWGAISDKIGRAKAILLMFLIQAITLSLLIKATSLLPLFLAFATVGFCFGGIFSIFPSATADFFGTKYYGITYGFVFTSYGVGGVLGPYLAGYIFDIAGSYYLAFQMAGILCAIALIISIFLMPRKS